MSPSRDSGKRSAPHARGVRRVICGEFSLTSHHPSTLLLGGDEILIGTRGPRCQLTTKGCNCLARHFLTTLASVIAPHLLLRRSCRTPLAMFDGSDTECCGRRRPGNAMSPWSYDVSATSERKAAVAWPTDGRLA